MFDLSSIRHRDSAEVAIHNPQTGAPTGVVVVLASADSPVARAAERELRERSLTRLQLGNRSAAATAREIESDAVDMLVRRTLGWSGFVEGGKPVPFSADAALRLYTEHPWLRRQVDDALGDRSRFFEASASSSSATPDTSST
ncbi:hypothetical protein [Myxococcus sp. CA040A]|uniref:hypothetical protein n=1 Tax=Myxococcus sp. CA040A TaxID=2741738 RepID=UPI00157B958C|nr:hypothetical protein [Myxococcus sp. CA040A]NTX07059.1 hypothetical protein [Myxococcus sp. CA040A]